MPVIALLLAWSAQAQPQTIAELDSLAQTKNTAGLQAYLSPQLQTAKPHVLDFLTDGGSYGVGRLGWHVYRVTEVGGAVDAVFSTPLTCEDMGEQVFRWQNGKLTAYLPEADDYGIRLLDHDILAHFNVSAKTASFQDTVQFDSTESSSQGFLFRLGDDYSVQSITDSDGKPVQFDSAGGVVAVPAPAKPGKFSYKIDYSGVVDRPEYAGSISSDEILLAQDYWYPTLGRQAAPYSLTSYTPRGWKVEGQGVLVSQRDAENLVETHYRMDLPVVYYSFSAAPFHISTDTIGKWKFSTFSKDLPESTLHIRNILQSEVIAFYDKTYWPYPFKTWGTVATRNYGGGALEAYSYATYGQLPTEDAHEPSHTWWGGILPNSYLKSQWNESFAVFSEGFFQRERDLGNKTERRTAFVAGASPDQMFNAAPLDDAPPEIGPAAGTLGYGKGSLVLQVLEQELGTDSFLKCIHEWIRSHKLGTLAEWSDFEEAVNRATGKDYSWFFDEWVHHAGWPVFQFSNVGWSEGKVKAQVQFSGRPYRITLEALLHYPSGREVSRNVVIGNGTDAVEIPSSERPQWVSFDPWRRLPGTYRMDEAPVSLSGFLAGSRLYIDPAHKDWMPSLREGASSLTQLPDKLAGVTIVGSPESIPQLKSICAVAGFQVKGDSLTYQGTTINLEHGGALAVVDLPGGGRCGIALGKTMFAPDTGRSRLCVVDEYGRFLRGVTEPKRTGFLTYRL